MPAEHDLDPPAMTEAERLAKRRYQAYFAFETDPNWNPLEAPMDNDPAVCDNCGQDVHTAAQLAECIDSMLGPPREEDE